MANLFSKRYKACLKPRTGTTNLRVCSWACLAESIALLNGDLQPSVNCLDQLLGQRCSAAVQHTEATKIIFVNDRMFP